MKCGNNPATWDLLCSDGPADQTGNETRKDSFYGENVMHSFDTEGQYRQRLQELKEEGAKING